MFDCDFFFFKQKTAYEMRISDWSSDVCSSDLDETGNDPFQIQTASPPETPSAGCEADGCLDFARHERVERNEETNGVEGNSDTNGLRGWGHAAPPCPSHARLYKRRHHGRSRQQPARSEERRVGKECVRTSKYRG